MNGKNQLSEFLTVHQIQLINGGVPEIYWPTLHNKLSNQIFDAGESFNLLQVAYDEGEQADDDPLWRVEANKEIPFGVDDPSHVYLVDHAWTFRTDMSRRQLVETPGLATRMAQLMDLEVDEESLVDSVMEAKWKFSQTYSLGSAASVEERQPVWYVMDEFGSRIPHSDDPNVRVVPFLWAGDGLGYSLLFPIKSLELGDEITRDYVEGQSKDQVSRSALLCAWQHTDLTSIEWRQTEPDSSFFTSARLSETLPDLSVAIPELPSEREILVYSQYEFINRNLTHPRMKFTDSMAEADILWLSSHFKDYEGLSVETPEKRINQFPHENVITIKDMLCVVSRRVPQSEQWLPITFNLVTELPQFVSYFQQREIDGHDNHWIVKPWNLARGLDTQVSKSLSHILRLPASGPKVVQKYLHNPVLFYRPEIGHVKFDIRYIILLQSVEPLKVFAYDNFWLRFANIPFSLDQLHVYEKHFTVMNYNAADLKQMFCHDFIKLFEDQYPDFKWSEVEKSIFSMLKEVFIGATSLPPPCGISPCPQAGAMYAVDLMLDWSEKKTKILPKVLEFNFLPDCERACDYYPDFFNNVFSTLFLKESENQNVTLL